MDRAMIPPMQNDIEGGQQHSKGMAFLLWLPCLFFVCGIHRFYLGKPLSGLVYLLTFGLFGVGQLVDLLLLPGLVDEANTKNAALQALAEKRALRAGAPLALPPGPGMVLEQPDSPEKFRVKLVQAAAQYGGKLSVTQGVMATGKSFEEVEHTLDSMVRSGYVDVTNDDATGVVVYNFGQLQAGS
jgi:TM2 domain-containing membrane protein YozV